MRHSDQADRRRLEHLEAEARTRPRLHRIRLIALVGLGYIYPLTLVGVSFAILIGMIALGPMLLDNISGGLFILYLGGLGIALALLHAVLKAFLARMPLEPLQTLGTGDAPALREMIAQVGRETGSPPVHAIYFNMSINAGVTQRPRFGVFGPRTNHLFIGLPLLAGLTPEQFRVVLAHEFAHLRGRHSSFSAWIFRLEHTWQSLAIPIAKGSAARRWIAAAFCQVVRPPARSHYAASSEAL